MSIVKGSILEEGYLVIRTREDYKSPQVDHPNSAPFYKTLKGAEREAKRWEKYGWTTQVVYACTTVLTTLLCEVEEEE